MDEEKARVLERLVENMRNGCVLVEGKRDKAAMEQLGCKYVLTTVGRVRYINNFVHSEKVIVATDLDKSGNQLAKMIKDELEGSVTVDCETRLLLGKILRLKYFEDMKRKYDEFYEKEKGGYKKKDNRERIRRKNKR